MSAGMIELQPFGPKSPDFAAAIGVYRSYVSGESKWAAEYFAKYAALPDYLGFVAKRDGRVAGMGFGARVGPGNWWYDAVTRGLAGRAQVQPGIWSLNEFGVLPEYHRTGVGSALMERILALAPGPKLILSAREDNFPARHFYAAHGWCEIGTFPLTTGGASYVICTFTKPTE